jgi:hypothetical protein
MILIEGEVGIIKLGMTFDASANELEIENIIGMLKIALKLNLTKSHTKRFFCCMNLWNCGCNVGRIAVK